MKKYRLELNEEQVKNLMWALNLYSRLKCGQFGVLKDLNKNRPDDNTLAKLQKEMFPKLDGLHMSFGIASPETPEEAKVCYDIYKQIHFIWNPVGVYSYEPHAISKQGLPKFWEVATTKEEGLM